MNVLVGYATAHGSTRMIAEQIAATLSRCGFQVDARPLGDVEVLDRYEAFVLGSAIHDGRWLPEAASFVERNADHLANRPVWLFSVSALGETTSFFRPSAARALRRMREETDELAGMRLTLHARGHRHFAGAVEREHWSRAGNAFLRAMGGHFGDFRDLGDIDAWATGIGRELGSGAPAEPVAAEG